jgi:diguanylate cyclase
MNSKAAYTDVRFDKSPWGMMELRLIRGHDTVHDVHVVSINASGARFFGLSQNAMHGKNLNDLFPSLLVQYYDWCSFFNTLPEDGSLKETQQYVPQFNRHVWVSAFRLDPEHVVVYFQDVTQAVNDQADRLAIITALRDLVLEIDEGGRFIGTYTSDPQHLFLPRQQLLGKRLDDVYPEPFLSQFKELLAQSRNLGGRREWTYKSYLPEDSRWFTAECRYLSRPDGGIYLVGIKDVSRELHLEAQVAHQQDFFELVARGSNDGIFDLDLRQNSSYLSPRWKATLGYADDELENAQETFQRLIHPEDRERVEAYNRAFFEDASASQYDVEFRMIHKDGHLVYIRSRGSVSRNEHGQALRLTGSHTDITAERLAQDALASSEAKYRLIAEHVSDVIWVLALDPLRITYISPSITKLRGIDPQNILNLPFETVIRQMGLSSLEDSLARDAELIRKDPQHALERVFEIETAHADGHRLWLEINTSMRVTDNGTIEVVGVSRDITHRKQIEAELTYLSFHDQLTGLYNRAYYETEMARLDVERNLPLSLILCDINGLKITNDAFGHQAGDELLVAFGNLLRDTLRQDDIIARAGGDEFVVLLPKTDHTQATLLVQRLREAMMAHKPIRFKLSSAIGCATKTEVSTLMSEVYKTAEDHMYAQKVADRQDFSRHLKELMMNSLIEKHPLEKAHSENVRRISKMIGDVMGLDETQLDDLEQAAYLHDIGKIGLDDSIVRDPFVLSANDFDAFKRHPEIGYQVLRSAYAFTGIADIVLTHHENLDGSGYPKGLQGEAIPLAARIIHVANDYDVLIHRQDYGTLQAVEELRRRRGTQLDPLVVDAFIDQVLNYR